MSVSPSIPKTSYDDVVYHQQIEPRLFAAPATAAASQIEAVLARVPKSDFHCHLNGSISPAILAHMESLLADEDAKQSSGHEGTGLPAKPARQAFFSNGVANACQAVLSTAMQGERAYSKKERMQHCFKVFDNVYMIMGNLAFTRLAVQDMLFTSAAENVMATEIRTSLRDGMTRSFRQDSSASATQACTKEDYVWAVVSTVEHLLRGGHVSFATGELISSQAWAENAKGLRASWHSTFAKVYGNNPQVVGSSVAPTPTATAEALYAHIRRSLAQMHVRLLVSINRGGKVDTAVEAVAIAKRVQRAQVRAFHSWCVSALQRSKTSAATPLEQLMAERLRHTCWVTGMDLSGNCYRGVLAGFLEALQTARQSCAPSEATSGCPTSLAITLHAGEKLDETELSAMVAFRPERWGHLVFTDPANLSRLLHDGGGIELCISSNLLTGGHEEVREHHLTRIMQEWWALTGPCSSSSSAAALPSSAVAPHTLPSGFTQPTSMVALLTSHAATSQATHNGHAVYDRTAQLRRLRRLSRWSPTAMCALTAAVRKGNADLSVPAALPNVAFHTDDRGVFQTTLTHELYLAAQHPAVYFNDHITTTLRRQQRLPAVLPEKDVRDVVEAMWALQRLALLELFELPWTVWELVFCTLADAPSPRVPSSSADTLLQACVAPVLTRRAHKDWKAWDGFVRHCHAVAPRTGSRHSSEQSAAVPVAASEVERVWLTACFDGYRLDADGAGNNSVGHSGAAASVLMAVRDVLKRSSQSAL